MLAKAHQAAATKPGLKYLTHSAHRAASGAARATRSVKQRADNVRTTAGKNREIRRENTETVRRQNAESKRLNAEQAKTKTESMKEENKMEKERLSQSGRRPVDTSGPADSSSAQHQTIKVELVNEPQTVNPVPAPDTEPASQQQPDSSAGEAAEEAEQ